MVNNCTIHQMVLFSAMVDPIALHQHILVGGFKHFLFSISYMGCHPSHWRTHIFQGGYCTTNQHTSETLDGEVKKEPYRQLPGFCFAVVSFLLLFFVDPKNSLWVLAMFFFFGLTSEKRRNLCPEKSPFNTEIPPSWKRMFLSFSRSIS